MKKKFIVLLLLACMISSLIGCKKNNDDPTSPDSTTKPTATATNAPEEGKDSEPTKEPEATPTPKPDFNGRVVRVGAHWDMTPDPTSSEWAEAWYNRIKFVEEEYNCTIEFVNVADSYSTYVTTVLAGDPIVDVAYVLSYRLLPAFIEGGIAYPLSDLSTFDRDLYQWSQPAMDACYYKEKDYAFAPKGAGVQYGIWYNKTLFNQYGLPDLYELYQNNEWTWDKLKEVAIAGNKDLDNDGTYDIWGFNQRENLVWSFMTSNGAEAVNKTQNGLEINLESKEAKEALEGYADFMQNVEHLQGWLGDWQSQIWSFRDGESMMCYEAWWISSSYLVPATDRPGMADDYGFVPFPMGPSSNEYVSYGKETSPFFMLNGIENPEEVMEIMTLIYDVYETEEEWDDMVMAGFETSAPNAESLRVALDLSNKNIFSPLMGFGDLNTLINNMLGEIGNGSSTPQTALETYKSALDAAIEDIKNYDPDKGLAEYMPSEEVEE